MKTRALLFVLLALCCAQQQRHLALAQDVGTATATATASGCDPVAALTAAVPDAGITLQLLTMMGMIDPATFPKSGMTIYLPADESMVRMAALFPGDTPPETPADVFAWYQGLADPIKERLNSVLAYHVTPSFYDLPATTIQTSAPTALSYVQPGYQLTILPGGAQVLTASNQTINRGAPRAACGNTIYVIPELMVPAAGATLPLTTLESTLWAFNQVVPVGDAAAAVAAEIRANPATEPASPTLITATPAGRKLK